jgi:nucleotide-binding universal stress UspA family protein
MGTLPRRSGTAGQVFPGGGVKIIIGANPDDAGADALALGAVLCRALAAEPVLCHVHPAAFNYPGPGHVDAEWNAYLHGEAEKVLAEARATMADEFGWPQVRTVVAAHRSSGLGLADAASAENADLIAIGSAPGGADGRFGVGSTADKLLHGSPVPIAVAPAGYRRAAPHRLGRVVVGFQNTEESRQALAKGAEIAEDAEVPLTVLTVLIRHRIYGSRLGPEAEDGVLEVLQDDARAAQAQALADLGFGGPTTTVTAIGETANAALRRVPWQGDEVFVLASASGGQLRRVFLGDMTYKLLRATPVPAIVLPRHTGPDRVVVSLV